MGSALPGRRRSEGQGPRPYPAVGLKDALARRGAQAKRLVAAGSTRSKPDRAARKAAKPIPTFKDIAKLVVEDAQGKSVNAKVRYQWERHLGPAIPARYSIDWSTRSRPSTWPPCCARCGDRSRSRAEA